jgi:hypothetical protein
MSHYLHIHDHIGSINTPVFMAVEFLLRAIPWTKDIITKTSLDNFYPNKNKQKQIAKEKSEPNNKEIYSKHDHYCSLSG